MKNLSKEHFLQALEICEIINLSYLIWMKSSQSRPKLSKQRLDQKSKESGATKRFYTTSFLNSFTERGDWLPKIYQQFSIHWQRLSGLVKVCQDTNTQRVV